MARLLFIAQSIGTDGEAKQQPFISERSRKYFSNECQLLKAFNNSEKENQLC